MLTSKGTTRRLVAVEVESGTVLVETVGSDAGFDAGFDEADVDAGIDVVAVDEVDDVGGVGEGAVEVEAELVETYKDGSA